MAGQGLERWLSEVEVDWPKMTESDGNIAELRLKVQLLADDF